MQVVKLTSGFLAHRLNESEREIILSNIVRDISPVGKNIPCFTPIDNLKYYIISEKEIEYNKYITTIKANKKKIFAVKHNICNQDEKINKAVRKAYGK